MDYPWHFGGADVECLGICTGLAASQHELLHLLWSGKWNIVELSMNIPSSDLKKRRKVIDETDVWTLNIALRQSCSEAIETGAIEFSNYSFLFSMLRNLQLSLSLPIMFKILP